MLKKCIECEVEFDTNSKEKRRVGGLITHCPSCSGEQHPKALGFASGDGKMASISILKFESQKDADNYRRFWMQNSGTNTGKNCQIGRGLMSSPGIKFKTITKAESANHKGKAA